jgi:hypothetical protein
MDKVQLLKKSSVLMAICPLIMSNALYANANTLNSTQTSTQVNQAQLSISQTSNADDDSRFENDSQRNARIVSEANAENTSAHDLMTETISNADNFHGYATYKEYMKAQKAKAENDRKTASQDTSTETGDADEVIYGGVNPSDHTGYVTFRLTVPDGIHEVAYINVMNMNTYKVYGCDLYEVNDWETQMSLPQGIYIVQEADLVADCASRFYTDTRQFEVDSGSNQVITCELHDSSRTSTSAVSTTSTEAANAGTAAVSTQTANAKPVTSPGINVSQAKTQKKSSLVAKIICIAVIVSLQILAVVFVVKKYKDSKNRPSDFES